RGGAPARQEPAGGDLPGMPVTLSANRADHEGGALGGAALGFGDGSRVGAAPPARYRHRRRFDREPDAHALHDSCCLSLSCPGSAVVSEIANPPSTATQRCCDKLSM